MKYKKGFFNQQVEACPAVTYVLRCNYNLRIQPPKHFFQKTTPMASSHVGRVTAGVLKHDKPEWSSVRAV